MPLIDSIRLSTAVPNANANSRPARMDAPAASTDVAVDMVANCTVVLNVVVSPVVTVLAWLCIQTADFIIVVVVVNDIRNRPGPCWSVWLELLTIGRVVDALFL